MPEYLNVSNTHLQISEHRFAPPNSTVFLTEAEAAPLMKGGWLIDVVTSVAQEVVDGEISNFVNRLNHLPPTPIDVNVNFPLNSAANAHDIAPKMVSPKDRLEEKAMMKDMPEHNDPPFVKAALARAKAQKAIQSPKATPAPGVLDQNDVFDSDKYQ